MFLFMTVNSEKFVDFATYMRFEPKFTAEFRRLSSSFATVDHFNEASYEP